jgi:hypothetical protein
MHPRLLTCVTASLAAIGAGACTVAPGDVQGGEPLFDAALPSVSSSGSEEAGPVTWTELYDSYFGPTGVATCSVGSGCHAGVNDLGAMGSGFVCGMTGASCFAGLTSTALPVSFSAIVPEGGTTAPTMTTFYKGLDGAGFGGVMPLTGPDGGAGHKFTKADLARIAAWIDQGAQDN